MKNFFRVLRASWKYRKQLIISIFCAFIAATFWGLNLTIIYPVLEILGNNQTLEQYVDTEIQSLTIQIDELNRELEEHRKELKIRETWLGGVRDREMQRITGVIVVIENKKDRYESSRWRFLQLKNYVIRYLPDSPFNCLAALLGFVMIGVVIRAIFEFFQEYLVGMVMTRTLYDMRNQFFRHVLNQDLRQFQENSSSELMSRFTNDMEILGSGLKILYGRMIAEPLRALSCILIACWISWQLTLLFMVLVPLSLFLMMRISRRMKRATRRVLDRMSSLIKILQENFHGIRIVKGFTMESHERRRFCEATRDYRDKSMRVVMIDALAGPIVELMGVAAVILALLAGAYLVLFQTQFLFGIQMSHSPLQMETMIQLFALLAATADPVRKLSSVYTKLQSAAAASDRIFTIMERQPLVTVNPDGHELGRVEKNIEFRNVCFSYNPMRPILANIDLSVKSGECIGIVGANGSGKSTLLSLLARFFDPDHGSILIDGYDIRTVHLRSLRTQIGMVTQDAILFDETIANNIAYGNRFATSQQIEEAAKRAYAHDFIVHKLPRGYDTRIGEIGNSLSGGEKQRIALARTILRNPSILILDEFTNTPNSTVGKMVLIV